MKGLNFSYRNSLVAKSLIVEYSKKLDVEIENMKKSTLNGYYSDYAFLNLVDDINMVKRINNLVTSKKQEDISYLLVIGIGGSNLGTIAVLEAIKGKFYNNMNNSPKILFLDNADSNYMSQILTLLEDSFKENKKVLVNLVSKSGSTTESIANFEIILSLLKRHITNYNKYVIVTTDKDSELYKLALANNFEILEIPNKVGGRFSVLSNVSLFPLAMVNVDIGKLIYGAKSIREICLKNRDNPAIINAAIMYLNYQNKKNIYDCFLFSNELEGLGKWYRQLIGESIGKEFDKFGNKVNIGITPTVSIGSKDLHSIFQLYVAGPRDKLVHLVTIKNNANIKIPSYKEYNKLVNSLQNKSLSKVMESIEESVRISFSEKEIPFTEIGIISKDEFSIGQFLMLKEIEIVLLASLFNINPFDQPNVEMYKEKTKKLLKR
jgi:glucose-6-phosphate isomerase